MYLTYEQDLIALKKKKRLFEGGKNPRIRTNWICYKDGNKEKGGERGTHSALRVLADSSAVSHTHLSFWTPSHKPWKLELPTGHLRPEERQLHRKGNQAKQ